LKFYLSSQNLYYGYCNGAKYHCTYDIATDRLTVIPEADMIAASGEGIIKDEYIFNKSFIILSSPTHYPCFSQVFFIFLKIDANFG